MTLRETSEPVDVPRCYLPPLHTYRRNWLERLVDFLHDWMGR